MFFFPAPFITTAPRSLLSDHAGELAVAVVREVGHRLLLSPQCTLRGVKRSSRSARDDKRSAIGLTRTDARESECGNARCAHNLRSEYLDRGSREGARSDTFLGQRARKFNFRLGSSSLIKSAGCLVTVRRCRQKKSGLVVVCITSRRLGFIPWKHALNFTPRVALASS